MPMRLSECLNSSDIDTLRKIADAYRFDCSKSSKNALMQEIMAHFNNRKFLSGAFTDIKEAPYREAVSQLMLDSRGEFSREEVLAMVRRASPDLAAEDAKWMQRLMHDGWLFRLNAKGGRQLYLIPEDLRKTLRQCLSESLKQRVKVAEEMPLVYRDENLALVRDTMVFLNFVGKNDIRITKDGTIIKRTQAQILSLLEIKEEALGKVSWRFGYGRRFHDYPDRFALIYDYCQARELIVETAEGTLERGAKADAWLLCEEKERLFDLFRFWRLLYRRPIPKLKLCINTLIQTAKEDWVHVDSMNELLVPYVGDYYFDKARAVMEQRIYNMLVHQGLLAHGQLADGSAVLRVTALGRELLHGEKGAAEENGPEAEREAVPHAPLILQPNFDILVPVESYARIEGELEVLTELIRVDTMRVHRITKASCLRAFEQGRTAETVLAFLRTETGDMVPGNVERMIEQWAAEAKRVRLYRSIVVECREEQVADALKVAVDVAPHLRLALTPTHFLIAESGLEPLQRLLKEQGYGADLIG
jgi:hypothetical protein